MKSIILLIFLVFTWVSAQTGEPTGVIPSGEPPLPATGGTDEPGEDETAGTVDPNKPQDASIFPRCSKQYEEYVRCGPWCEPSCENPEPKNCIKKCFTGCRCRHGYYRNKFGYCVKWSDCPQPPTCHNVWCPKGYTCRIWNGKPECYPIAPTCQNVWCAKGYVCKIIQGKAECVREIWEPPGCAALRCTTPGGCALVYPLSCFIGFCNPQPTCVSYNACLSKSCPAGQVCVLRQVLCVGAPCYHVAECIPQPR